MMRSSIPPRGWTINIESLSSCGAPSFTEKLIGTTSAQELTESAPALLPRAPVAQPRQRWHHLPTVPISHRQLHRHALALGEAVEHALQRDLAADAPLLVAASCHPRHL